MKAHHSADAHIVVAYQKLCKIEIFIFIIQEKCNIFPKKSQSSDSVNTCKEGIKGIHYVKNSK